MKAIDVKLIEQWESVLNGVYTMSDLKVLFGSQSEAALYKKLQAFVGAGILVKVKRGIYARQDASLREICARICPDSYVSFGGILADAAIIGSVPGHRVQAVKVGSPRTFSCSLGTIDFLSIAPHLFFGFATVEGIKCATPEKAFLDACYFTYKGRNFSFDIDTDVDKSRLDSAVIASYLAMYDRKFLAFYRRVGDNG